MSEILFEYIRQGNMVKVTAIDPVSRLEAVVVAPADLSEAELNKLALDKLRYLLQKQSH
ncbi:MAG: hypothetical protein IJ184_00960 [Alphaproteobacteria bacterium]|nr:hypothetical protein [Alphaproteobacteria bacterium]